MFDRQINIKLALIGLIAVALAIVLAQQMPFIYGPSYWKWHAHYIAFWRYVPAMLPAAAPLFAALSVDDGSHARRVIAIALVMISMLAMQIVHIGMTTPHFSLSRIEYFVESPMNTSYFSDAAATMDVPAMKLMSDYPQYLKQFDMHSREKPPGPVLFFRAIIAIFGVSDRTALIAGITIGLLSTLCVPATYLLIRVLLNDSRAAFAGCAMLALCPGMVLNFPMLDTVYAVFTCALIVTWVIALRSGKLGWAIAFGVILSVACFVVYHFLVLGVFLGLATIAHAINNPRRIPNIAQQSLCAVATVLLLYFLLYALTGFQPIDCFRAALQNQSQMLPEFKRPYPRTILFDLTDFALGAAWIPWTLAVMTLLNRRINRPLRGWSVLAIVQILAVALSGLLQAETARVWCFLLPLLMLASAIEISRWSMSQRLCVYAAMWLMLCLVGENMAFMY